MIEARNTNIKAKDIMRIEGLSRSTAFRLIREMRDYYDKSKPKILSIKDYADYKGFELDYVLEKLKK